MCKFNNKFFKSFKLLYKSTRDYQVIYLLNLVRFVFKIVVLFAILTFNAFIFCWILNHLLKLPKEIYHPLDFSFSHDEKSIFSNIYFNCTHYTKYDTPCNRLDDYSYTISLDLDLAPNSYNYHLKENVELEFIFYNLHKKFSIKKLIFLDSNDGIVNFIHRMTLLPFRILGLLNSKNMSVMIIEDYDNNYFPLLKLEVLIKNKNLNILNGFIRMKPNIGYIKRFLALLKLFTLPVLFGVLIAIQLLFYIIYKFIINRIDEK